MITHTQPKLPTANYENAATFDGFRFAREREAHLALAHEHSDSQGQEFFKRQMISTGVDHLPFGTGKHACPVSTIFALPLLSELALSHFATIQGRFFAATELKAIMAHVVLTYDVKAEVEGVRPPDNVFGTRISPNATGKVQFRKRQ